MSEKDLPISFDIMWTLISDTPLVQLSAALTNALKSKVCNIGTLLNIRFRFNPLKGAMSKWINRRL